MALPRSATALARTRPAAAWLLANARPQQATYNTQLLRAATAQFSTSASRQATPAGPPPAGFRIPSPKRWDQEAEGTMDKVGKYFLLTELFRGMWVVLEQFFRPP